MPMRDMVAGDAQLRSCVSKRKLTLGPNWMRSPLGSVRSRLSSRTEFRLSIHSGSMSPSQIIQELTSAKSWNSSDTYPEHGCRWCHPIHVRRLSVASYCKTVTLSLLPSNYDKTVFFTLWLPDHFPGTICEDTIRPLSGVHVYLSQQLLSWHGLGIHYELSDLEKQQCIFT